MNLADRLLDPETFEEALDTSSSYELREAIRELHARLAAAKAEGAAEAYETVCREVTYAPAYTNMLSQRAAAIRKQIDAARAGGGR